MGHFVIEVNHDHEKRKGEKGRRGLLVEIKNQAQIGQVISQMNFIVL